MQKPHSFNFHCPSCEAEGKLTIDLAEQGQIPCPEGCGASFIAYEGKAGWALKCVVQPVFK